VAWQRWRQCPAVGALGRDVFSKGQSWTGVYHCTQGPTSIHLEVKEVRDNSSKHVEGNWVEAELSFAVGADQADGKQTKGTYRVAGDFVQEGRTVILEPVPDSWQEKPSNFVMVGLHGVVTRNGNVDGTHRFAGSVPIFGCDSFELKSSSANGDADATSAEEVASSGVVYSSSELEVGDRVRALYGKVWALGTVMASPGRNFIDGTFVAVPPQSGSEEGFWGVQRDDDKKRRLTYPRVVRVLQKLPTGWSEILDEDTQRWYYWHASSGTSSWQLPRALDKISSRVGQRSESAMLARLSNALDAARERWRDELQAYIDDNVKSSKKGEGTGSTQLAKDLTAQVAQLLAAAANGNNQVTVQMESLSGESDGTTQTVVLRLGDAEVQIR